MTNASKSINNVPYLTKLKYKETQVQNFVSKLCYILIHIDDEEIKSKDSEY